MKPVEFKEQNVVFAKDQPEYLPLPAYKSQEGQVISCWQLDEADKQLIAQTGVIYISVHTFNNPLQPIRPSVDSPFIEGSDG